MSKHADQWLYKEGMAYLYGLNFKKQDLKLGQSMIEASASSGFAMAVAECRCRGWNGMAMKEDCKKAFERAFLYPSRGIVESKRLMFFSLLLFYLQDDEINLDSDLEDEDDVHFLPARATRKRLPKKCPITQMAMDNPYVTPCGHIFSKLGLYCMLKKKQVIECPRCGCPGTNVRKSTIKPAEINLDLDLDQEEDGRRRCYNKKTP